MASHHCHRDPWPQPGLTPERLQARRQLYAACAVCFVFMAGEVIGGYLAHSLAIMTDAAHLLADVGSMMGSLFSLWLSTRPATRTMTFGWHRSETLGALASVVSLWMVTGILLYLAFIRLLHSDYHIEGGAMLLTASIAVCANLLYVPVWSGHRGYLAHSLAIMTDAAHLLADVGSMMGSLFSLWLSTRPATRTMTFGWHRSETLGALASVVSLWMVTGILLYLAFIRLLHSDYHIEGGAMLLTASIAVCANLLMAFVLHQAGPPHSHGARGAEYAPLEEEPGDPLPLGNTSVRAAFVHVLGDLLQSLGVLAASILIYFKPQYKVADPISTFLFSICALGSTAPTLRDVLRILMEGTPRSVGFEPVRDTLLSVPGVRATHELHLWALTLTYHVASAHLAIDAAADPETVLAEASARLYSRFGFSSCTLQVEQYQPEMAQCLRCQEPPQA
ncbi:Zinc transporter 3 [Heterocephalus glaber]|uniref:Probable proton-coupled zinc antiporter SLC30A3 n=1 Tax=Heterocephalus glaber TaxID=10181 RepID=G5BZ00_HETGA|nr:Zinc transporter 3 [Heterocephalus glaber]